MCLWCKGKATPRPASGITPNLPSCGGNVRFVVDCGGKDECGCGVENNSFAQRGGEGGFLIDRPSCEEAAELKSADPSFINPKQDE